MKIEHHPAAETRLHWQIEVNAFRDSIEDEFRHSPSLHARQEELAADAWRSAFRLFREELRLRAPEQLRRPGIAALDAEVPAYPAEAALRFGWYPEPREE